MANAIYRVTGRVIDGKARRGVGGLRVEAWDKDQKYHDLLGVAVTDVRGGFRIKFDETYFREYAPDNAPDLFFKVYRNENLLKSTEDSVLWNAKTTTELTIEVDIPAARPTGKDRVTAAQVIKEIKFMQKSDFRSLWRETGDRTSVLTGFVADMVKNTVRKMDLAPIKPGALRTRDVVNQDVPSARKNLEDQGVTVNQVKPYQPGVNVKSIADVAAFPMRLKAGQKVDLYEENGRVRYYSVVREPRQTNVNAADMARLDQEVTSIRSDLGQFDVGELGQEISAMKTEREALSADVASLRANLTELSTMHRDLSLAVARDRPVKDVTGVTTDADGHLRDLGIRTVNELATARPADLTKTDSPITQDIAKAIIKNAKKRVKVR